MTPVEREDAAGPVATLTTDDPRATDALGRALGACARPGDVLLLTGDLGTGKTTLTAGVAAGAGSADLVSSPTFVLLNQYRGRLPLYHADLYRLEEPEEVAALALGEVSEDGLLVVEWPERGAAWLPEECLTLALGHAGGDRRQIALWPRGERAAHWARETLARLAREGGGGGTDA
jgi:tRNA threonylcarbamoyladenosine biosynthesis protein TsaE